MLPFSDAFLAVPAARERHRQLCEETDEKNRTMMAEAKQRHAEDVKMVHMNNEHRLVTNVFCNVSPEASGPRFLVPCGRSWIGLGSERVLATAESALLALAGSGKIVKKPVANLEITNRHKVAKEEFDKRLASVMAHNWHVAELSKAFTRRCAEIGDENQFRIQRGEEEFQAAWKAFVEKVGGEEAAAELLEGKAEWRESAWAWREYVSMVNTASITDRHLSTLRRRIVEEGEKLRLLSDVLEKDPASVGASPWPR